jgi:hypothetical protein
MYLKHTYSKFYWITRDLDVFSILQSLQEDGCETAC